MYDEHLRIIEALESERSEQRPAPQVQALPATAAVRIASGAELPDAVLHPLPQRPTDAQRLGIEVHSWIEELHRGLIGLAEEEALEEPSVPPDPGTVADMQARFRAMGFEDKRPLELPGGEPATEVPFTLKLGDDPARPQVIRGRIDAVYEHPDGALEIVDFKTGAAPEAAATDWGQLELYAEALRSLGLLPGEAILTFAFLRTGEARSRRYTPRGLDWLVSALAVASS
jgi:DNA helicase-2/ATP-dependent DNA helicase PcrA